MIVHRAPIAGRKAIQNINPEVGQTRRKIERKKAAFQYYGNRLVVMNRMIYFSFRSRELHTAEME